MARVVWLAIFLLLGGCDTSNVDSINHMNKGKRAYKSGDATKAKELMKKAIASNAKNHEAHHQLGVIYEGANDFENAIANYKRATQEAPKYGNYFYFLGKANQSAAMIYRDKKMSSEALKHFSEAEEALVQAVDLDKYHAKAYYRLGQVRTELGKVSEAIDAYEYSIQSDPSMYEGYNALGLLYSSFAFYEQAAQVLLLGVKNLPTNPKLRTLLGNVYMEQKRFEEAVAEYDKARKINEENTGDRSEILGAVYGMGMAYAELKNYPEAKKWLSTFVANAGGQRDIESKVNAARGKISEIDRIEKK